MANYECSMRSNYFHVKDEKALRELITKTVCSEENLELFESKETNGRLVFGFCAYGSILGIPVENGREDEYNYDGFVKSLQKIIEPDDAIIIFETGHEKLRYICECASVITANDCVWLDMSDIAVNKARKMLNNPNWKTDCSY